MENNSLTVYGLGSAQGLDRLGWRLVEQLADRDQSDSIHFQPVADPALLAGLLLDAGRVLLLDAAAWPAGEVRQVSAEALAEMPACSSHATSLVDTLQLARTLNPALQVAIIGIGIAGETHGVDTLCEQVLAQVRRLIATFQTAD